MMKRKKWTKAAFAVLLSMNIFLTGGCGKTEDGSPQTDIGEQSVLSEVQTPEEIAQTQDTMQEQSTETLAQGQGMETLTQEQGTKLTQEQIDAENLEERAMLEGKVQAAGGISEEEAIEIAREAMETDIGRKGEKLKLRIDEIYGWRASLEDITDWDEYKGKGEIAYFIQFDDGVDGMEIIDMTNYHCVINAVNGSILDAYEMVWGGSDWKAIYYKH